ncbi:methyl-accepting chemotaxis protein [Paraburkholderia terrae]|uniref:methyl-accepting chemotaxis protein n=1 Tax=Paraburkholderia terrae TaxID=311230 RepID=UPI00296AC6CA|nr:methyl-accepting chemotaxis protein [Paraburkholderia terrae]MDW3662360.1 methyl-accepting chemotaxis protein [Paraburkholderia terrae]
MELRAHPGRVDDVRAVQVDVRRSHYRTLFCVYAASHEGRKLKTRVLTIRFKLFGAFGVVGAFLLVPGVWNLITFLQSDVARLPMYRTVSMGMVLLSTMGCIVSIYCGAHLNAVVCGGLNRMGKKLEDIAETLDLSKRSSSPRMDEFGRAAIAFDALMMRVQETVYAVRVSADTVSRATRALVSGNVDISARTEEQAASLQETASSMTQLTETVKQNADNARWAKEEVLNATRIAERGGDVVHDMVATMGKIHASSSKISEITGVIEGIAFQTNILALNAAVEAARAGEQGRGFAVVASEVRGLAQRSASAAREIKELIVSSVATTSDGSEQAARVSAAMDEMKTAIEHASQMVTEIANASEQQSRGIEQVNQAVILMDQVTQRNAAVVEQGAFAAQSLEEQTEKLGVTVASFKLPVDSE